MQRTSFGLTTKNNQVQISDVIQSYYTISWKKYRKNWFVYDDAYFKI